MEKLLNFRFRDQYIVISRRQLIGAAAIFSAAGLSGCGFRLRGAFNAPFKTMYLQMAENTPFSTTLARQIRAGSTVELVDNPNEAEAILVLINQTRSSDILSINDAGRAREYELTMTIDFRVSSPEGFDYLVPTQLTATREMSYSEVEFLSREKEENFLYSDMEKDLIGQILRYIEAIKPQEG